MIGGGSKKGREGKVAREVRGGGVGGGEVGLVSHRHITYKVLKRIKAY